MMVAVALENFGKGSRCHLLNLINPLSVRKGLRYPKILTRAPAISPERALGFVLYDHNLVQGEHYDINAIGND